MGVNGLPYLVGGNLRKQFSRIAMAALAAVVAVVVIPGSALAASQAKSLSTPYGTLTSNVWRSNGDGYTSGNTRQWDFQVSAVIGGSQRVTEIRTTWTGSSSLRSGASWSVTAGSGGISAGASSSWQYISLTKYWSNTNGARSSSYRSNIIAAPSIDYRSGSIYLTNTAFVKFYGDSRSWSIGAGV